ncbi:MAG: VOC family protein [Terriglobales bacterium]
MPKDCRSCTGDSCATRCYRTDEIKLLFLEFQSAGVTFLQKLKKQPWGAKNFVVKDPDGNLLLFAGPQTNSH